MNGVLSKTRKILSELTFWMSPNIFCKIFKVCKIITKRSILDVAEYQRIREYQSHAFMGCYWIITNRW